MNKSTRHAVIGATRAAMHLDKLMKAERARARRRMSGAPGEAKPPVTEDYKQTLAEAKRTLELRIESAVRIFGGLETVSVLVEFAKTHAPCDGCDHPQCFKSEDAMLLADICSKFKKALDAKD